MVLPLALRAWGDGTETSTPSECAGECQKWHSGQANASIPSDLYSSMDRSWRSWRNARGRLAAQGVAVPKTPQRCPSLAPSTPAVSCLPCLPSFDLSVRPSTYVTSDVMRPVRSLGRSGITIVDSCSLIDLRALCFCYVSLGRGADRFDHRSARKMMVSMKSSPGALSARISESLREVAESRELPAGTD
jgi:hypothetical protein